MEDNVRPWGRYDILLDEDGYKVKKITVNPGKRLSLQYHLHREENWFVVKGEGVVTVGDKEILRKRGDHIFIPVKAKHRIENTGKTPLVFIEVQIGDYLGEDDIVRVQDDYGRV